MRIFYELLMFDFRTNIYKLPVVNGVLIGVPRFSNLIVRRPHCLSRNPLGLQTKNLQLITKLTTREANKNVLTYYFDNSTLIIL